MKVESNATLKDQGVRKKLNQPLKYCEGKYNVPLEDDGGQGKHVISPKDCEGVVEHDASLKYCEENYFTPLEDNGTREKLRITAKNCGGKFEYGLYLRGCEGVDNDDILMEDHCARDKHVLPIKDYESRDESDLSLRDGNAGDKHVLFSEDHGGIEKYDLIPKDFRSRDGPDLHLKYCEDNDDITLEDRGALSKNEALPKYSGDNCDTTLDHGMRDQPDVKQGIGIEYDFSSKDCKNNYDVPLEGLRAPEKNEIILKDHESINEPDLFLKNCEDNCDITFITFNYGARDKRGTTPKHSGSRVEYDLSLKDCENNYDVPLDAPDKNVIIPEDDERINKPDLSLKNSENSAKHDIFLEDKQVKKKPDATPKDYKIKVKSDLPLKDCEDNYVVSVEDHVAIDKSAIIPKDCGSRVEYDLSLNYCGSVDKDDILMKDHDARAKYEVLPKENEGESKCNVLPKDCESEHEPYVFLKDSEVRDKQLCIYSKVPEGGDKPDMSSAGCEVGEELDVLVKGHLDGPDILSKDYESENKFDVLLEDRKGRIDLISKNKEELGVFLKGHKGENKTYLFSKDCGNEYELTLSFKNHEKKDNSKVSHLKDPIDQIKPDESSLNVKVAEKLDVLLKYLEDAEKSDFPPLNCEGREKSARLKKNQNDEWSNKPVATSNDHEIKDLHALLRDLEDGDKLPLKDHGSSGKHSVITCTPSETHKVSKNKKKKQQTASANLYQAYLDLIYSEKSMMNADLLAGKNIQPSSLTNLSNVCEKRETLIAATNTAQPVTQTKSNEGQAERRLLKKYPHHKKGTLRRDFLAESAEAFLPILGSEGHSKEMFKYFDGQGKLDRSGPSSNNVISKSKDVILPLTPSSREPSGFSSKRSGEHMLPSDFRIPKKRKIDSPSSTKIQSRLDFQVVIMKDLQGSPMRDEDLVEVQHLLNAEVMRVILGNERPPFVPQFFGFRVDQIHKWLVLKCEDRDTMRWVLNCRALNDRQTFRIVKFEEAPWRSIRIYFTIRKDKPEVKRVVRLLASQNRILNVAGWSHFKVTGYPGEWTLYFLLTVDESKQLDKVGWVVFFELGMLKVSKV